MHASTHIIRHTQIHIPTLEAHVTKYQDTANFETTTLYVLEHNPPQSSLQQTLISVIIIPGRKLLILITSHYTLWLTFSFHLKLS